MDMKKVIALAFFISLILGCEFCQASKISQSYIEKTKHIVNKTAENDVKDYIDGVLNGRKLNIEIFRLIKDKLFSEIDATLKQIATILVVTLIYTLIYSVQNSLKNQGLGKTTFLAFFLTLSTIVLQNLKDVLLYANEVIQKGNSFVEAIFPILISTLATMGYATYAASLSPKIVFALVFSSEFLKNIILPIVNVYIVISILSNIDGGRFNLRRLLSFLKTVLLWSIVIGLVVFTGIVSIEGFTGVTVDNLVAKSIKYTVGNFVPFVGKILSDAADTLAGSLGIIKNTISVVGLLTLLLIVGVPLLKILIISLLFRLTAAFVGIISDSRFAQFLDDYADNILLIFSIVFASLLVFVVTFSTVLFIIQVGR
ncbi:stage III sporulation protein AE [Caldicellulosiruptor sp. DIB 104C]|uniref:stage III sporulation protein AE n=1 Tax=Caldicellulosiruptor sp. DIB 104C TaxID=3019889 RepID=UPI00230638A2|nr:stage III sporulation protein AE [Caldicellulosiruptor sp. DIB 104C]